MKAVTVEPLKPGSAHHGSVLVETVAVGVCGTDVEIVEGKNGWAPPGKSRLVLGHESSRPRHRPRLERQLQAWEQVSARPRARAPG